MAYSKECKEEILSRFHGSGMSRSAACALLDGFPCRSVLSGFLREEEAGILESAPIEVPGRCEDRKPWEPYPLETKREAMKLLAEGLEPRFVAKRLNIASAHIVRSWAAKFGKLDRLDSRSHPESKREEVISLFEQGTSIAKIAELVGIHNRTAYRWLERAGIDVKASRKPSEKDSDKIMSDEKNLSGDACQDEPGEWAQAWGDLPDDDPAERARVAEVRLAEALAVLDVLKAPGPGSLSNSEKYRAGQMTKAMAAKAKIDDILSDFRIAKSTYFAQGARAAKPDKYAALRERIKVIFQDSKRRYGSLSIWAKLRSGEGEPVCAAELAPKDASTPVIVSEKVVRRIMREEGLVPVQVKKSRRYSSYEGEPDERPENLPLREDGTHDFCASKPGRLVVTDVTEFALDGFKVYLSPVIDCFDGCPVAWRASTSPDDELTAGSLEDALDFLEEGCTVHTDGGGNYRSRRWKGVCEDNGLVRSMSRKAKSPDNARAEGFFGTLKQEFFYARSWKGVTRGCFMRALNDYIVWYRDEKIKRALGWKTITAHRQALGIAA